MEHVEHFYKTGTLLRGTYYFDPPLEKDEILLLHDILKNIKRSDIILNPLNSLPNSETFNRNLIWIDVWNNQIQGWQNVDEVEDEDYNVYIVKDLESIKRWCSYNACEEPFRDGRLLLGEELNTEDVFNQLNESEDDFDWLPELDDFGDLENADLVNFLNEHFKYAGYDYRSDYDGQYYLVEDESGYYVTIRDKFTLTILKEEILNAIRNLKMNAQMFNHNNDETIQEYQELYQALVPLFEMT